MFCVDHLVGMVLNWVSGNALCNWVIGNVVFRNVCK